MKKGRRLSNQIRLTNEKRPGSCDGHVKSLGVDQESQLSCVISVLVSTRTNCGDEHHQPFLALKRYHSNITPTEQQKRGLQISDTLHIQLQ